MRIYLAAITSGMDKETRAATIQKCRPRYVLETFFNGEKDCLEAMQICGNDNFLLDSGAYSYMNGAAVTENKIEEYIERYTSFIASNKIEHFFEIDVDNIFGIKQVELWRRKIENAAGRQCIPVWHKGRGVEYWKRMCDEYPYVAIGGLVFHIKKQEYPLIKQMVEYAYNRGVKVHGLGFTKTKELSDYKFFSVDSASWVLGSTRGQHLYTFKNGGLTYRHLEKKGRKVDLNKLCAHNMEEWVKYQKFMDYER